MEMKCYKCGNKSNYFVRLNEFLDEERFLCPYCAGLFIEKLAEWKDFDLNLDLDLFCNK